MGNKERAIQDMYAFALEPLAIPGDAAFPLNAFYQKPTRAEEEEMKKYMVQLRHETGGRLVEKVWDPEMSSEGNPNKWWTCWAMRLEEDWWRRFGTQKCLLREIQTSGGPVGP